MLPVEFHPIAVREVRDAVRWQVRNRSPDVAQRFKAELHVVLGIVRETPFRFPETIRGARRAILRRFRYVVVFKPYPDRIVVVAFHHGARRPGYWKRRAKET